MYQVSDAVIEAYKNDGVHKEYRIVIDNVNYENDKIVDNSFSLKQSILDNENFEAIGCIASCLTVELHAQFSTKIRDKRVKVYINAGNTGWIQIFDGYVNKCTKTANGWKRSIEAYDYFYTMSGQSGNGNEGTKKKFDITDWYNNHNSTSVSNILNEVCSRFGLSVRTGNKALVNGGITTYCGKQSNVQSLSALDLIKAVMELNGCFGYITGDGYFSWKYLVMPEYDDEGWLYPSAYAYPSTALYPGQDPDHARTDENAKNVIGSYENLEYQDFKMLPINKVEVRDSESDKEKGSASGSTVSTDDNVYIIQGNVLLRGANKDTKDQCARNVYDVLNSTYYVPFAADLPGLPYIECGDEVNFFDFVGDYGQASLQRFYVMSRTLYGGQHIKDTWSANGDEYQHEFIVGTAANVDTEDIKEDLENYVDDAVATMAGCRIVSVTSISDIPNPPAANTIYCIQSEVQIVETIWTPDED